MRLRHRLARAASRLAFAVGQCWLLAGALRLFFGPRVETPLLPVLDLERVDAAPALLVGVALCLLATWLGRLATHADAARRRAVAAALTAGPAGGDATASRAVRPSSPAVEGARHAAERVPQ